jgi:hypothetical protein
MKTENVFVIHRFKIAILPQSILDRGEHMISKRIPAIILILLATSVCLVSAYIYGQENNIVTLTIMNREYYYVDNNTSDVDSHWDEGNHSNFGAQQQAPDSIYDNLLEGLENWLTGWDKRVRIDIDKNDVYDTLSDFPILVHLSNSSGRNNDDVTFVFDEIQSDANRKKIAVTTSDGTSQCYVEIENWNNINEQAWLWVKVPNISNTSDTSIYLYYDADQADNTNYVGDPNSTPAENVWDSSFKGVWHLSETSGGLGSLKDSTSNNNDGTDNGSPILGATGKIDSAVNFDGINDYINITNSASLQFTNSLTIEAWVNLQSFGSGSDVDIILRKGEGNPNDWQLAIHNQKIGLRIEENDDSGLDGSSSLTATTWYYIVGTWNGSIREVNLNGSIDGAGSKTDSIIPDTRDIYIGGRATTDLSMGIIDEVRASNTTRNAAWIKASYKSGRDDLLDFGIEEVPTNAYKLDLEVQWTNVDYSETNEELCIYTGAGSNNTYSFDATGGYMIVGDGTPDWGSTTGTISFWVKMDSSVQGRFWGQDGNMETRWSVSNLVLDWGGTGSMTSATSFSADMWYFVAIVWDENNSNLFLYVGDEANSPTLDSNSLTGTWTGTTPLPTENRFMNGLGGNEPLDGHGDDLRYWDVARPLAELQSDYNITLTGSETNLRSYFKLNNDFDDIGPNNNDGSGSGSYSFSTDVPYIAPASENLKVDVWSGASWENVIASLNSGWNNVSVSAYLVSSTFTIRFKGTSETADATQDTWEIDATLLHVWT